MKKFIILGFLILFIHQLVAPPVTQEKEPEKNEDKDDLANMEYHRYLKEVVEVLESDPDFRAKLDKADNDDIRNGNIANELELTNHHVRSKLDELKRQELERLRYYYAKNYELQNGLDTHHVKIAPEYLDHSNPHTFEVVDLKKLILKTTKDLDEIDRKRREKFKEYEMEKKFEQEEKMKGNTGLNEEERKKYEEELRQMQEKHKKHEPLHHPGSKQQLEEVWEKQDHMDSQDFDPRTFFILHDLDGNGAWDQIEVKALFRKELDKLYQSGASESDLLERAEEMERMREHVFKEADHNRDGFISFEEFLDETKKPEFQKDPGWETLDEQQIYSMKEYEEFQRQKLEEMERMKHMSPPQYGAHPSFQGMPPPNYVPQPGVQASNQGIHLPNTQYHAQPPVPQQHYQQPQGQVPHQQYQGQVPPQQYQGQVPPQQYQGQIPPQQYQGQVPVQQYQGHVPPQQYQGQVPSQQHQQGQVPLQQQSQQNQAHQQQQQQQNEMSQQQLNQIHQQKVSQQQQNVPNSAPQQQVPQQQQQNVSEQNSHKQQQASTGEHLSNSIPNVGKA